ncbi:MAG: flavodoxin domain-containing protein [Candidatus Bathyarchaeota archaeon]|jgi:flavodoxin
MRMPKGIVVYDSNFGNTEKIARALSYGLEEKGVEIDCLRIEKVDVERLSAYDFIAVGGPTQILRTSKPMRIFLKKLRTVDLVGKKGFSFDTRYKSRMNGRHWLLLENSAARVIEGVLKYKKVKIVRPRCSALVEGRKGPLHDGMEEMFTQMGIEIAESLQ